MNIFLHELRSYKKSIIIWTCSIIALAIMYMLIFKSLGHDIEEFKILMKNMPEVVKKAFNIYIESISTLVGFYSFVFSFVVLCGAIQAMNLGISIVSKEIRDKTADFLMTKPVRRYNILSYKLMAAFSALIITNLLYLAVTSHVALIASKGVNLKVFFMISITLFFVQLIFMVLGISISVIVGKIRSVISVSLSAVFGFYIIGTLGSIVGDDKVRYISPFRYFDTAYIVKNAAYELPFVIVGSIFIVFGIAVSYIVYLKKDIHAV